MIYRLLPLALFLVGSLCLLAGNLILVLRELHS